MRKDFDFQFMLKEYEMLYGKFEMHYDAVEKTFRLYLIIIGGFVSLMGFLSKTNDSFLVDIWGLEDIILVLLTISSITGILIYFKVVEHRLLIIAYVKALNLNRKWFSDCSTENIGKYFYFPIGVENPKYFKRLSHFYWEAVLLSFINALFLSILLVNLFIRNINFYSTNFALINCLWLVLLVLAICRLLLLYYSQRAKHEEKKMKKHI